MGWTTMNRLPGGNMTDWLQQEIGDNCEVVDAALVHFRTLYAAVRIKRTGEVVAFVFRIQFSRSSFQNFSYKDMDETVGPCETDCPERILDLLSPTDHPNALEWRARCRENIARRKTRRGIASGTVIRFARAIGFTDGQQHDTFVLERNARGRVSFRSTWTDHSGTLYASHHEYYRITGWREREFTVIADSVEAHNRTATSTAAAQ